MTIFDDVARRGGAGPDMGRSRRTGQNPAGMFITSEARSWLADRRAFARMIAPYSAAAELAVFPCAKPFIAQYRRGGRRLDFVACDHEADREGGSFVLIDRIFAVEPPACVLIEGFATSRGVDPVAISSLVAQPRAGTASSGGEGAAWSGGEGAAWSGGEGAHAVRHCIAAGIPFEGAEPDEEATTAALVRAGFARRDVANVTLVAALAQDRGTDPSRHGGPDAAAVKTWAAILAPIHPSVARDIAALDHWWRAAFAIPLPQDSQWSSRADPGTEGIGSAVMRALNLQRDRHVFDLVLERLARHGHVAVVFGGSHLASLWSALQAALGQPEAYRRYDE